MRLQLAFPGALFLESQSKYKRIHYSSLFNNGQISDERCNQTCIHLAVGPLIRQTRAAIRINEIPSLCCIFFLADRTQKIPHDSDQMNGELPPVFFNFLHLINWKQCVGLKR